MLKPAFLKDDHILLPGAFTKNGETAQQWITPDLRKRLADALPFELPPREEVAQMLYDDLALARDLWIQAGGKKRADFLQVRNAEDHVLDFHALRHTCGAWLAISGVNPKVIQKVMRHSRSCLTLDTYGHLLPGETRTAVTHIGKMLSDARRSWHKSTATNGIYPMNPCMNHSLLIRWSWVRVPPPSLCNIAGRET